MAGNLNDFANMYQQFRANPMQMLSRRFNIPQNINNPSDMVQHLLNTEQITQEQVNNAMGFMNNPMFQRMMGHK